MNITPNFTLAEMTRTSTKLDNTPNAQQLDSLRFLCYRLEIIRKYWSSFYPEGGGTIVINSAFRSWEVNKAVGGSPSSNHLTGCAADIACRDFRYAVMFTALVVYLRHKGELFYDELYIEVKGKVVWVHLAVSLTRARHKFALIVNGKKLL